MPEERLATVTGKAATEPLNKADPEAPSNRRITILLRREATPAKPLGRGASGTQSSPFSNYQAPVLMPAAAQADEAADRDGSTDPLEASLDAEEAAAETPVEETADCPEPSAPETAGEAPPPEETAPAQDEEFIDSDLWQCL